MKQQILLIAIAIAIAIVGTSLITNANAQGQSHKFFMAMKLRNPHPDPIYNGAIQYDVYNIASNLSDKNLKLPILGSGKNIEYNVKGASAEVSNSSVFWAVPYKIIDNSTPDVIKTTNAGLRSGSMAVAPTQGNFEMAHNTKTNVTTYSQSSSLDTADFQHVFDNVNTIVTT